MAGCSPASGACRARRGRRRGHRLDPDRGVPGLAGRHRRAAGRQDGHHPVAGDDRPADQPADRQSGQHRARSRATNARRLPRHQHQHRHHHARHADARRHDLDRQRRRRRHLRRRHQGRRRGRHRRRRADAVRRHRHDGGLVGRRRHADRDRRRPPAAAIYSFTGLAPGDYIVRVDQNNFIAGGALDVLATQISSPGNPDPDNNVDNDDNGSRSPGQPAFSQAITLAYNTEPTRRHRQRHQQHARLRLLRQPASDGGQCRAVHRQRGRDRPRASPSR